MLTWYEELDRTGGEHIVILLRRGEEVVGITEAAWDPRFPDRVEQMLTGVARAWRGRGLAKALKAAMLHWLREHHPEVRLMITGNAEANAAIRAINDKLGFAVHREHTSYQLGIEALRRYLGASKLEIGRSDSET
ncbi:MAG: GNAT family N-acetyltransferase [Acetobacteraceae bacterium]|nr:GNAT family N-acetyltransferase [Acetobacteraceae bacterium]